MVLMCALGHANLQHETRPPPHPHHPRNPLIPLVPDPHSKQSPRPPKVMSRQTPCRLCVLHLRGNSRSIWEEEEETELKVRVWKVARKMMSPHYEGPQESDELREKSNFHTKG